MKEPTMKTRYLAALTALALSGSLAAETVVTVNGVKIDSSEIERRAKIFQANSGGQVPDGPQLRNAITNELITEVLVTQEAKRLKLDKSSEYQAAESDALKEAKSKGLDKQKDFKQNWADYQNHLLMMAFASNLFDKQPVSADQVKRQYEQVRARYQNSSEVQLGEIFTDKAEQAQAALKDLSAKKKFSEVAAKYSISGEAKQTGGIVPDYVPLNDLKEINPEVYQAVAALNKGQYTKTPLKEGNIHLILYVNDKRQIQFPGFEQAKEGIEQGIRNEQLRRAIDELSNKAKIVPAK